MSRRRHKSKKPFVKPIPNCVHCNGEGWEMIDGRAHRCQCIKKQLDAILGGFSTKNPSELHDEYFRENFRDGKSSAYKDE